MYLLTAATRFEMEPFLAAAPSRGFLPLVTGVGPTETITTLLSFIHGQKESIRGMVNFGIGGAYLHPEKDPGAELLDICLARREVFGDLGVCLEDRIERIRGRGLDVKDSFVMDPELLDLAEKALLEKKIPFQTGNFVTVSSTSGTLQRGEMLASQFDGLCENMEGAAVARVGLELGLPCLEVRCISNLVEDRDTSRWKIRAACRRSGEAAAYIVSYLMEHARDE